MQDPGSEKAAVRVPGRLDFARLLAAYIRLRIKPLICSETYLLNSLIHSFDDSDLQLDTFLFTHNVVIREVISTSK